MTMIDEVKDITVAVKRKKIIPKVPLYREYRVGYTKQAAYNPESFLKYFSEYEMIPDIQVVKDMIR